MLQSKRGTVIRTDLWAGYTVGRYSQVISLHNQPKSIWCASRVTGLAYRTDFRSEQVAMLTLNRCLTAKAEQRCIEAHRDKIMNGHDVIEFCKELGLDYAFADMGY